MHIHLKSLHIKNFRGFVDETIIFDERMNVIIGKNDVGKSTILEALEIFFNSEQIKIDPLDKNIHCNPEDKVEITCCFSLDDDAKTIIDSSVPVRLDQEYLLNSNGELEICKMWDCSKKTIGAKDLLTYIVANYPCISEKPLVCEKISSLKNILKECVSSEVYDIVVKTKSSEIRKAIYTAKITEDTEFQPSLIDITQEDAKNIWYSLQQSLPLFFLFRSDRVNSDKDSEVQTPMKAVTKTVISEMQDSIEEIINNVKEKVEQIGTETIKKLSDLDPEIAKSLKPKVSVKPFESVFTFDLLSDDEIPLNKRGSGVRRLILLSYFRTEAEKKAIYGHNHSIIYALEEPETSQHPDFQKMIIEALQELSCDNMHQIIITTHTPEIAKMVKLQQLIFIYKNNDGTPIIEIQDEVKYQAIASALGILPFVVEQCVICVEGENDVNFLSEINKIPEFKNIIDFESQKIRIIPLQGCNLVRWVNSNYFAASNIKEIHFYDNDREDYHSIINGIKNADDSRRFGWLTKRREMENYIPPKIIESEFNIDLTSYYDTWENNDIPKLLNDKIFLEIKDIKEREKVIKAKLNGSLSKKITTAHLKDIGAFDELETFFKNVKAIYENTYLK